ncbi:hypothetical protein [Pseudomonas sp. LFM046]|uniref:hypothetical protein n=1 Tax=Pseudomonas sp. LFM046 TaxID=1608357 RepID=UPI0005CFCCEB|nr:hypothetical protein [Pseudomonas sp. LFM046]
MPDLNIPPQSARRALVIGGSLGGLFAGNLLQPEQAIRDLAMARMVDRRVLLLGDAAAIPRPHTAASTSKAASNALTLVRALERFPNDPDKALARWEAPQVALGRSLYDHGREIGDHLLFHRRPAHCAS